MSLVLGRGRLSYKRLRELTCRSQSQPVRGGLPAQQRGGYPCLMTLERSMRIIIRPKDENTTADGDKEGTRAWAGGSERPVSAVRSVLLLFVLSDDMGAIFA